MKKYITTTFGALAIIFCHAQQMQSIQRVVKPVESANKQLDKTIPRNPLKLRVINYDSILNSGSGIPSGIDPSKWSVMDVQIGDDIFKSDCTPEMIAFNRKAVSMARTVVWSKAFEQGLRKKIMDLYIKCKDDPFYSSNIETQYQKVLAACRAPRALQIQCTGGSGNASSALGYYDLSRVPEFSWSTWLTSVVPTVTMTKICTDKQKSSNDVSGCRWSPYPWPYSQAAGSIWHEFMHYYGYRHGANDDNNAAKIGCGISEQTVFDYQRNTIPYIVGNLITEIIDASQSICGNIANCPAEDQLRLIDGYGSKNCSCFSDPAKKTNQLAPPEMASQNGAVASISRKPGTMQNFWIGGDGSVWSGYWYEGMKNWEKFQLAPPGMASKNGDIAVISRSSNTMQVFWIGGDGSVWNASWYEETNKWERGMVSPPETASRSGGIAAISGKPNKMEVFWVGGDGSIWTAFWYKGNKDWSPLQIAPADMASKNAGLTAISRRPDHSEVFWIGGDGSIQDAVLYDGMNKWRILPIAAQGSASQSGDITAVSRDPAKLDIFWIGADGSIWTANWEDTNPVWPRKQVAPPAIASQSGALTALSRTAHTIETYWLGGDGTVWFAQWDDGPQQWQRHRIAFPEMASRNGGISVCSKYNTHREIFWVGGDGSIWDANWYDIYAE